MRDKRKVGIKHVFVGFAPHIQSDDKKKMKKWMKTKKKEKREAMHNKWLLYKCKTSQFCGQYHLFPPLLISNETIYRYNHVLLLTWDILWALLYQHQHHHHDHEKTFIIIWKSIQTYKKFYFLLSALVLLRQKKMNGKMRNLLLKYTNTNSKYIFPKRYNIFSISCLDFMYKYLHIFLFSFLFLFVYYTHNFFLVFFESHHDYSHFTFTYIQKEN